MVKNIRLLQPAASEKQQNALKISSKPSSLDQRVSNIICKQQLYPTLFE